MQTGQNYTENHYGDSNQGTQGREAGSERKERQLTEESAFAQDDSTDSPLQGCAGPAVPRDHKLYRTEM